MKGSGTKKERSGGAMAAAAAAPRSTGRRIGSMAVAAAAVTVALSSMARADVITAWNEVALETIRTHTTTPPEATRALAMMHTAMFDSVNAIDGVFSVYYVQVDNVDPQASREAAAAQAAHDVLASIYPDSTYIFDAYLTDWLKVPKDLESRDEGVAIGQYVASEIIAWRATDGFDAQVEYTPGNDPGQWRPTPPGYLPALLPQWPFVTPWAMTVGTQFRGDGPPALDSQQWADDYNEVKSMGSTDSQARTRDETEVAHFWSDGAGTCTPPGHWNMIAETCAKAKHYGMLQNARMFAELNVALADAAIVSWDNKYAYSFWRPITAIQEGDADGNAQTEPDPNWTPLLGTPNFPEYTSGHSTFSGASSAILASIFGSDTMRFRIGSDAMPGVYRTYHSFTEAAEEAGQSRIYGGIHYQTSNQDGLATGAALADFVTDNYFQPVSSDMTVVMPTPLRVDLINRFEAFNCTPNMRVYFVWGHELGTTQLRNCPEVTIGIASPKRFVSARADSNGYASANFRIARNVRNQFLFMQAYQSGSCRVSNVLGGTPR